MLPTATVRVQWTFNTLHLTSTVGFNLLLNLPIRHTARSHPPLPCSLSHISLAHHQRLLSPIHSTTRILLNRVSSRIITRTPLWKQLSLALRRLRTQVCQATSTASPCNRSSINPWLTLHTHHPGLSVSASTTLSLPVPAANGPVQLASVQVRDGTKRKRTPHLVHSHVSIFSFGTLHLHLSCTDTIPFAYIVYTLRNVMNPAYPFLHPLSCEQYTPFFLSPKSRQPQSEWRKPSSSLSLHTTHRSPGGGTLVAIVHFAIVLTDKDIRSTYTHIS